MEVLDSLVEWDQLDIRVRGAKVKQMVHALLREKQAPVSDFDLEFLDGELRAGIKILKPLPIPIKLVIREIGVQAGTVRIPLENVSTYGSLPVPKFLFQLIRQKALPEGVSFDPDRMMVFISLERFLPPFVRVTVDHIRVIQGGLAVRLGSGGAAIPPTL